MKYKLFLDASSSNPTTSYSNENENQYPEVRIRQNPQAQHVSNDGDQVERRPPPNWRFNIKVDEKLTICRKYYIAGFFLLPIFWLVNFVWYYHDAYLAEPFEEQAQFRRYVLRSGIGFVFWTMLIVIWVFYFQTQRYYHDWDYLTYNFPTGSA